MVIKKKPTWQTLYAMSLLETIEIMYPEYEIVNDYKNKLILVTKRGTDETISHHGMDKKL